MIVGEALEIDVFPGVALLSGVSEALEVTTIKVLIEVALLFGVSGISPVEKLDVEERKRVNFGAGSAVAAHEHISTPADDAAIPFSTPQASITHPIALPLIALKLAASHIHARSSGLHPTETRASLTQDRYQMISENERRLHECLLP